MDVTDILVVIPHSGLLIPSEIPFRTLSTDFPELAKNVDWHTDYLYDFQDILGNRTLKFPYCSLILEANRNPDDLDSSVPLRDALNRPVYRTNQAPDLPARQRLSHHYLHSFHQEIEAVLSRQSSGFLLDAHSTVTARGMVDNQIELMNYQINPLNGERQYFCPDSYIQIYAEELARLLPEVRVTVNQSLYHAVYGHVCGAHAVNAPDRVGQRVPAILQETNQNLYLNSDYTPNLEAVDTLRRAFARALKGMIGRINRSGLQLNQVTETLR